MKQSNQSAFPNLSKAVRKALKQWHDDSQGESPFAQLYLLRKASRENYNPRHATNQVLLQAFDALAQTHAQETKLLKMRFLDLWSIYRLANHFNVAESTIYIMQREAIERLTERLRELEMVASAQHRAQLLGRLAASSYSDLVGMDEAITHLVAKLSEPQAPWLVAIEGIGGIGKTALADATIRHALAQGQGNEIGWVSARQTHFNFGGAITVIDQPALTTEALIDALVRQLLPELALATNPRPGELLTHLRTQLKQTPHLIVIDNLETVVDVESLLPTLQELADPSKFLLTTRQSVYATPNVYHFQVPELSEASALQLVRQEAVLSNLPVLAAASDAELRPIYATVGGNPLALRLVVGQTHIYTLESILHELQAARGQTVENLYTYIYRRVWDSLDAATRNVLLIMPLANPQGDELEVIAEVGDLTIGTVRRALNHLVTLNLVDARGGLHDRRYSIHGLTRTFLHEQVLQWQI